MSGSPRNRCRLWRRNINVAGNAPFSAAAGRPRGFRGRRRETDRTPVISGELNPVFQGIYSTRIEVKQAMREMERLLTTAEKLNVIAGFAGCPERAGGHRDGRGSRSCLTRRMICRPA